VKLELRAMTNSQRMCESAETMSSTTPSAKYSCSGSPLRFRNGSTAIEGLSGRASACADVASALAKATGGDLASSDDRTSSTAPMNRKPLRASVRIRRCSSPLSPIALRTALM
jgi:hypothetical protein